MISDPWKPERLVVLPVEMLQSPLPVILTQLQRLNDSNLRLPVEQADSVCRAFLDVNSQPFDQGELDVVLFAVALARHPKAPAHIDYVLGMEDSESTKIACRALLAWHGLPDLFLIWIDDLDCLRFAEMPLAAQDYIRGVDLSGTWERCGIWYYFEEASPDKLQMMAQSFERMGMSESAAALEEAVARWGEILEGETANLPEPIMEVLRSRWEAAAWRMNDSKNSLLAGISRFAARHSHEFRNALGWISPPPVL